MVRILLGFFWAILLQGKVVLVTPHIYDVIGPEKSRKGQKNGTLRSCSCSSVISLYGSYMLSHVGQAGFFENAISYASGVIRTR
jgi:hypothetical protein